MDKDKLVLKDGTEVELEFSQGIGALHVSVESKAAATELWERFTAKNLEQVTIRNSGGEVTGAYTDMVCDHITGSDNDDGKVNIVFCLRSKTTEEILLEKMESLESELTSTQMALCDVYENLV